MGSGTRPNPNYDAFSLNFFQRKPSSLDDTAAAESASKSSTESAAKGETEIQREVPVMESPESEASAAIVTEVTWVTTIPPARESAAETKSSAETVVQSTEAGIAVKGGIKSESTDLDIH